MQVILHADQRPQQNHKDENLPILPQKRYLLVKESGPMLNQGEHSISDYAVFKKLIHLLRHAKIQREDDGAIEFWRTKDDLQKYVPAIVIIGLTTSGRKAWQVEEETRTYTSIVLIRQE